MNEQYLPRWPKFLAYADDVYIDRVLQSIRTGFEAMYAEVYKI